jgi:hypothetical protein
MSRLERLEQRRLDPTLLVEASMRHEAYRKIKDSESVRYAVGAMQPIDPEYTKNTFAQGDRVKSQLQQRLTIGCDFEYQGSITTDTHIKARSDIDLLMIRQGWFWLDGPNNSPYQGDPKEDMRALRRQASTALSNAFPAADVDEAGSTAINVTGGSLSREVDVVPASWYDTSDYQRTGEKVYRGVKVFNKETGGFVANTPFLHKRRIELRDQSTYGGLRKACRLMKSLMYDSEGRVEMSSYNIVGIAYNIPEQDLIAPAPRELVILESCFELCQRLAADEGVRSRLLVPDGHRCVFGDGPGASLSQVHALTKELDGLRRDVVSDNVRSFRRLIEARVEYPELTMS